MRELGTFLGVLFWIVGAYASDIQVIEHDTCNEIRLNDASNTRWWNLTVRGVSQSASSLGFESLQSGVLERVGFGSGDSTIKMKFVGKKLVPDVIAVDEHFSIDFQALRDDTLNSRVGRFMGFTDLNIESRFQNPEADGGPRERILFAAMYFNDDESTVPLPVNCSYISGDIDLGVLRSSKSCIWIDHISRGTNGKPYCW